VHRNAFYLKGFIKILHYLAINTLLLQCIAVMIGVCFHYYMGLNMFDHNPGRTDFSTELDGTITFRVNSELKQEFQKLCKSQYSDVSRELNSFMRKVVAKQKLDIENHNVMF
ncbi:hypothetical protein ACTXGK_14510, partial [Psychrobacter sp. T6-5]|uniref:hypothetical protein n=1 Tax=Psychrobacter sp. T6-5 TaxID=3457451 RepID=UPI003FD60C23